MAITFDVTEGNLAQGVNVLPVDSGERPYFASKAVSFDYLSGDGTALQSGEDVTLMVLGKNVECYYSSPH